MLKFTDIASMPRESGYPVLGSIRLGVKVAARSGSMEFPEERKYFVIKPERTVDIDGEKQKVVNPYLAKLAELYGPKPLEIAPVLLPSPDIDISFPRLLMMWGNATLRCWGNGKVANRRSMETGEWEEVECPCEFMGNKCKHVGRLFLILPEVSIAGVFQIVTGNKRGLVQIDAGINGASLIAEKTGRPITSIPLRLTREPHTTSFFDKKKGCLSTTPHYAVKLVPDISEEMLGRVAESYCGYEMPPPEGKAIGPSPDLAEDIAAEDGEVVVEEKPSPVVVVPVPESIPEPAPSPAPAPAPSPAPAPAPTPELPPAAAVEEDSKPAKFPEIVNKLKRYFGITAGEPIERYIDSLGILDPSLKADGVEIPGPIVASIRDKVVAEARGIGKDALRAKIDPVFDGNVLRAAKGKNMNMSKLRWLIRASKYDVKKIMEEIAAYEGEKSE